MTAPTVYHLRNNDGVETFTGTIFPAPGGGSQPGAVTVTITAAQVAAGWSNFDSSGVVELTQIPAGAIVLDSLQEAPATFDQNVSQDGYNAYTSGGAPTDVINAGDGPYSAPDVSWPTGNFSHVVLSATMNVFRADPGSSLWMKFSGDAAPTTGEYVFTLLLFYPAA